jgi:predicted nuclease with TOPRIM domain
MLSLEHVQLLESKVAKAIEYVQRVTDENSTLSHEKSDLLAKLNANQKRLDELELLVMRFKEDQGRIEDGVMAALNRLSQFEEAFETSLSEKDKSAAKKTAKKEKIVQNSSESDDSEESFEIKSGESGDTNGTSADELDIF